MKVIGNITPWIPISFERQSLSVCMYVVVVVVEICLCPSDEVEAGETAESSRHTGGFV